MSQILYYSNFCQNSQRLLQTLKQSACQKDIHFLCVDRRVKGHDGTTNIVLQNGQQVQLPPTITKVPALLLPNRGFQVLFGEQIYQFLQPREKQAMASATNNQGEPECFAFGSGGIASGCIASDQYSFWDMDADSLSAKGNGGMRQMHNYVSINGGDPTIETPPDTYQPDKVGDGELERIQQKRNEINQGRK